MAGKGAPARVVLVLAALVALTPCAVRADERTDLPGGDPAESASTWPLLRELKQLQVIQFQEGMRARIAALRSGSARSASVLLLST